MAGKANSGGGKTSKVTKTSKSGKVKKIGIRRETSRRSVPDF